jgi:hypothetical protein
MKTFIIILTTADEYRIKLVTDRTLRSYRKKLLNGKIKDLIIPANTTSYGTSEGQYISYTLPVKASYSGYKLKAFVFSNLQNIMPLTSKLITY